MSDEGGLIQPEPKRLRRRAPENPEERNKQISLFDLLEEMGLWPPKQTQSSQNE